MSPITEDMAMYVDKSQQNRDRNLIFIISAHNSTVHATTCFSPFFLMFGREPALPVDTITNSVDDRVSASLPDYARQMAESPKNAYEIVRGRINVAQVRNTAAVDKCRRELLQPGDFVKVRELRT